MSRSRPKHGSDQILREQKVCQWVRQKQLREVFSGEGGPDPLEKWLTMCSQRSSEIIHV